MSVLKMHENEDDGDLILCMKMYVSDNILINKMRALMNITNN